MEDKNRVVTIDDDLEKAVALYTSLVLKTKPSVNASSEIRHGFEINVLVSTTRR